jgi:DNA-binding NtrC family response regulator
LKPRVLIVDDERRIRLVLDRLLKKNGYEVRLAEGGEAALKTIADDPPDLILLDLKMPGLGGMETLQRLRESGYAGKVVIMTAYGTIESAVEAMREGAYDYITKPFSNEDLLHSIERALDHERLKRDLENARRQIEGKFSIDGIIAASPAMVALLETVRRVAPTGAPALIIGESGTGKEVIAKAIHQASGLGQRPFVAINCGALPPALMESELFGYKRGAFTGADRSKAGLVSEADGGTLFLDEIAELSPEAQTKLLRFTETGEYIPLGDTRPHHVSVRLLAATNRDLEAAVAEGRFRADLFYRLNVVMLKVPPLRERAEEIPLLIAHFIKVHGQTLGRKSYRFDREALELLSLYHWPGNVRELENAVRSALLMADSSPMSIGHLPLQIRQPRKHLGEDLIVATANVKLQDLIGRQQSDLEIEAIQAALKATDGNRSRAAKMLSISRNTLLRKIRQYNLR